MTARVRTGYSFGFAAGHQKQVLDRLLACAARPDRPVVVPITDRGNCFGHVPWSRLCDKAGVRPAFGVELPVTSEMHLAAPEIVDHITFLAQDDTRSNLAA